ncbi:MAG: hypothetical protein ACSNEK_04905 [Parachlamydiaceae bacterium]
MSKELLIINLLSTLRIRGTFMAAPIQRYSDPRLYGTILVKPFNQSYQWTKTVTNPFHPNCNLVTECTIRAIKTITGVLALAFTALPALIGRVFQVMHYHSLSKSTRAHPPEVIVDGIRLPHLQNCPMPASKKFHETDRKRAIGILRWGFKPTKTASGAKMADAIYVSASDAVPVVHGIDQLILSLNLRDGEVAYVDDDALRNFAITVGKDLLDKRVMAAVRKLYYRNGYRAIRYELDYYGKEEAWAIYDPSCISVTEIRLSPKAFPRDILHLHQRQPLVW